MDEGDIWLIGTFLLNFMCPNLPGSTTVCYVGYYFTGDGALRDHEGKYRITGRVDDVITIDGHRIGTAEIESVMVRETSSNKSGQENLTLLM